MGNIFIPTPFRPLNRLRREGKEVKLKFVFVYELSDHPRVIIYK